MVAKIGKVKVENVLKAVTKILLIQIHHGKCAAGVIRNASQHVGLAVVQQEAEPISARCVVGSMTTEFAGKDAVLISFPGTTMQI